MSESNIYYYGIAQNLPSSKNIQAGKLQMVYENGFLRYIKIGNNEILRMIYFAVRDHNWDTIEGTVQNEILEIGNDHFSIRYHSIHKKGGIEITFRCLLTGDKNGHIMFSIEGEAGSTFMKNRIGFCVLHPISECVNKICHIEHWDDSKSQIRFPEYISPHQPFKNIRTMKWSVDEINDVNLHFEGDIFETEDQRNWTDASFKTYCTPLDLPFPVKIRAGDKINQKISIDIISKRNDIIFAHEDRELIFSYNRDLGFKLPEIGVGASSTYEQLDQKSSDKIKRLQLDHVRWDIYLSKNDLEDQVGHVISETDSLNLSACLALFFHGDPEEEYKSFVKQVNGKLNRLKYLLLFDQQRKTTPDRLIELLNDNIRRDFPSVLIGGGTNVYFTELNRERVRNDKVDFLVYSINPQVHAFDNFSLVETLEAQYETVKSAKHFFPDMDIMISPVTLKPRFNPNATGPEPDPVPGELPSQVDVRQMSLFGACWTLISIKYMAEAGVNWATYFETAGWRGLIQGNIPPLIDKKFKADRFDYFPVYQVFDWVKECKNGSIIHSKSSYPLIFNGFTVKDNGLYHIFLANFTRDILKINIDGHGKPISHKFLSENNVKDFMKSLFPVDEVPLNSLNNIELNPYSINWLTCR